MAGLSYVGVDPSAGRDTENRINVEDQLTTGISRLYVQGRVAELAAPLASKSYVNNQDALFESAVYADGQDALLIPNGAKGTPNGVATLGADGKIPPEQIPRLGVGILRGPFPTSHTYNGTTFTDPFKIADWKLYTVAGSGTGITCQPWVFMAVGLKSVGGRPVVEVRAGTPAQTAYEDQTLVAQGYGRDFYNDFQTVEVFPQDPDLNEGQDGVQDFFPPTMDMVLTAWMYDDGGGETTMTAGLIFNASAWLARVAL